MNKEIENLVGQKYIFPDSIKMIKKYGHTVTLKGTDNINWIAYFHKGNFTMVTIKKTDVIIKIYSGMIADEAIPGSLEETLKQARKRNDR